MSRLDFHIEFDSKIAQLDDQLRLKISNRLESLAADERDMIGAAVGIEELSREETPHAYQARIVAYARPENIAAVEKAETLDVALERALNAVERQILTRRAKFRQPWERPDVGRDQGVYELTPRELYDAYGQNVDPTELVTVSRTDLASRLMVEEDLAEEAAYHAADQILVFAQEAVEAELSA